MDWHRLFGLGLTDYFSGSPYAVDTEKDLSLKQQFLDVVIFRQRPGEFAGRLPDALEDLAPHNLLTFKSYQETLDDWALDESVSHYVTYRKQVSQSFDRLLPKEEFRLFAVSARYPQNLASQVTLEELKPGVYQVRRWGTSVIRVVVLRRLPLEPHNALWFLFSGVAEQVAYAVHNYRKHSTETSTLLDQLIEGYQREGVVMPYTMEDFRRDYLKEHIKQLSAKERLAGLSPEERLAGLPPEERLAGLPPEEIVKHLPPEEIVKHLPPEEVLKHLPRDVIENFLKRRPNGATPSPE
jgi:hypothetical protein